MYRGLLSRILVAALLIAVIAKPCLGLLSDTAEAAGYPVALADVSAVSQEPDSQCNDICLSARVEEVTAVLPAGTAWSGGDDWAQLKARLVLALPYLSHQVDADFSPHLEAPNVRERLAVLSRFLL